MLILWRGILIVLCCFAVFICYPNYADSALRITITWAGLAFIAVAILTIVTKALIIGRFHLFNTLLDIAIIITFLYILLNIFPQINGQSPYSRLKKGIYPKMTDIDKGLSKLGLRTSKETIQEVKEGVNEVSNNVNEVKNLILQEYKK